MSRSQSPTKQNNDGLHRMRHELNQLNRSKHGPVGRFVERFSPLVRRAMASGRLLGTSQPRCCIFALLRGRGRGAATVVGCSSASGDLAVGPAYVLCTDRLRAVSTCHVSRRLRMRRRTIASERLRAGCLIVACACALRCASERYGIPSRKLQLARPSLIPSLCTHCTRAGIEWRR